MAKARLSKAIAEKFAIGLQYESPDLEAGQTIDTVETAVLPVGLTLVGSPTIDSDTVEQMVSGGSADTVYTVTFTVTTSANHIYVDTVKVEVT